jgi:hypothetical protein
MVKKRDLPIKPRTQFEIAGAQHRVFKLGPFTVTTSEVDNVPFLHNKDVLLLSSDHSAPLLSN